MSTGPDLTKITDPLAVFIEFGNETVVAQRTGKPLRFAMHKADRRLRYERCEFYQRLFHKGLLEAFRRGAFL